MPPRFVPTVALTLLLGAAMLYARAQTAVEPAMQLPPDQTAFRSANGIADRQARAAALQHFLDDFPGSKRVSTARALLMQLLLDQQPQDTKRIHKLAEQRVKGATPDTRANEENSVAYELAEAPPRGVDLKAAEDWAKDSVKRYTYDSFAAQVKAGYANAKEPLPSEPTLRRMYGMAQASNLQTLADVYFHVGNYPATIATLDQAAAFDPKSGAVFATRGQVEHALGSNEQALDHLLTAEVYGGTNPTAHELLRELYLAKHAGSADGLEAEIDRRYSAAYPPVAPVPRTPVPGTSRTVLLELYTGSGCPPCVGADLALDAVIRNYGRNEVVALALDEHIPEPDPLANPASVARAGYQGVHFTPTFRIDGAEGPEVYGRERDGAAKAYATLTQAIDKQLLIPSGATLRVDASLTPEGKVAASASFRVNDPGVLRGLLTAASSNAKPSATTATPEQVKLLLNLALVQQEVRYSGENGIRFHSMVVRDLAKPTRDAFPVALDGKSTGSFTFDPAAVSVANHAYLEAFQQHNERFAAPHFLTTDTTLPLDGLAVAAWVEDTVSHRVVAAAFAPVAKPADRAAR